jgi:ATP-dependent exoDNAse (exonuclease V) beta subunit
VTAALLHPLLERARKASRSYRELPVLIRDDTAGVLEAVMDLVFVEDDRWIVIDFKTDAEDPQRLRKYRSQAGWYLRALEVTTGSATEAWLLHV